MNCNQIMQTVNILFPHYWSLVLVCSGSTTPMDVSSMTILLASQGTAANLDPPLSTGTVC